MSSEKKSKAKPAEGGGSAVKFIALGLVVVTAVAVYISMTGAGTAPAATAGPKPTAAAAEEAAPFETKFIKNLNHDTFMRTVGMKSHVLVLFHAPWCNHCEAMMPDYEQTAELFAGEQSVIVARVDASVEKKLKKTFSVTGYPTIFYFAPGSISPKKCETRNVEGLVTFLNDKAGTAVPVPQPPPVPLPAKTEAPMELVPGNIQEAIGLEDQNVFIMFHAPWCSHCKTMMPSVEAVAKAFYPVPNVIIARVDGSAHSKLKEQYAPLGFPTTLYFPAGSKESTEYNGDRNANAIIRYINGKAGTTVAEVEVPVVDVPLPAKTAAPMELAAGNIKKVIGGDVNVLVKFYAPWCGHCKTMIPAYEAAAQAFAGVPNVVIAKLDGTEHPEVKEKYGVSGFPTLKFFAAGSTEAVEYPSGRDVNSIIKYINEKAGTAVAEVEVPPEAEVVQAPAEDGPLPAKTAAPMELGAGNIDKLIGGDVNVLVKFYAPWCGHCKTMIPAYEAAAQAFAGVPNVVIAKLDGTAHPSVKNRYGISGFPTLMFFAAGSKEPVEYNSGRDLNSIVKYVNQKAGTKTEL